MRDWLNPPSGVGVSDHGALTGLGDDDHTQYLLVNGSRAMTGDLALANALKLLLDTDGDSYLWAAVDDRVELYVGGTEVIEARATSLTLGGTATPLLLLTDNKLQFRDTAIYIHSDDDGYLDLAADTAVRANGNRVLTTDDLTAYLWYRDFEPANAKYPSSNRAALSTLNYRDVIAFDAASDESIIFEFVVPPDYDSGAGALKIDILACANTTTAADDARIDAVTEFLTPGAAEAMDSDSFDGTADSGTFTFSTTAYSLQKLTITLTPGTTPAAGDKARIKITRDADHATLDSLAVDLLVFGARVYQEHS